MHRLDPQLILNILSWLSSSNKSQYDPLINLGYKSINVSAHVGISWSEKLSALNLQDFTLTANDMGSIKFTAQVVDVNKAALLNSSDLANLPLYLGQSKLTAAGLIFENDGLFTRALENAMQRAKVDANGIKEVYLSQFGSLLAPLPQEIRTELMNGISSFLEDPKSLAITAQAEPGIALAELVGSYEGLRISATANAQSVADYGSINRMVTNGSQLLTGHSQSR